MMHTAHLREGDYLACRRRLDGAGLWTILVEREMGSGPMMILKIARQDVPQVALVEDDDVIPLSIILKSVALLVFKQLVPDK
jgi:hypothetical protein